jgi:CzcA family heavy metal efflux pump
MLRWIIGSSLKFRFLVVLAAAVMIAVGLVRLREMPIDVFPEFAPPRVEIQTEGWGMSSTEVEELITIPLEESLKGTPELDVLRSKSVVGLSSILLIFKRGTDIFHARQLVQERLRLAIPTLPTTVYPPVMLQPLSATSRCMKIGISAKDKSLMDLSMTAYWTIRFRLMRVPGVANVAMWGERIKALVAQVDPDLLRVHSVSLNEVMEKTSEALEFGLLHHKSAAKTQIDGFVETPNQRLEIQHAIPIISPEGLARIPLRSTTGEELRLRDVGKVVWDTPLPIGDAVINDGPGLMLIIEKFPWANTLEVTRGVEQALNELRPGLPGIEIDAQIFRPATFIEMSIDNLTFAMLLGALLVILVIGAFLYEWRSALISVLAIPISLVAAGLVLYALGTTINTMVLAGLVVALGSVVDDAIIDVENIVRRLRENRAQGNKKSVAAVVFDASLEIRRAILFATLIIVVSVTPVFFLGGLSGSFFEPLAFSYVVAMLASLVVAMTVTPALGLILLKDATLDHRAPPLTQWLQRHYERALAGILNAPRRAFFTTAIVVVAALAVWPFLGESLLPTFKERDFLMHWLTKPGTSHPEMYRVTVQASRELRSIPGVRNFGAHIGRAIAADEVVGIDFTENWVSVDPKADYNKTLAAIQEAVDGYPGIYRDVQTYLRERIKEVLTGKSESIVVRLFGDDLPVLRREAEKVRQALQGTAGLVDLHVDLQQDIPEIRVTVNLEAAGKLGLKPGDVKRAAATIMYGMEVSDIHEGSKVYDVMVWSIPEKRNSLDDVRELLIDTPSGETVRLADVADVRIVPTPNAILREGFSRRIDVAANVRGRDLGSVSADVAARLATVEFPLGYRAEMLGEYQERQSAQRRMLWATLASVIAIFFLLQAALRSWVLASLVFLALPAALTGGILAAFTTGGIISLGSLVGFLTVLGVAARNGILLISHFQHLEEHEGEAFGPGLVLRGSRERLAPILMTTACTALALLPLAVTGDIPGHEVEHPMAIVILGGLLTSTLLNLFVVPPLYLTFGHRAGAEMLRSRAGAVESPA